MPQKPEIKEYRATPYLICRGAAQALDWYREAFDASEVVRLADPAGRVMHAEFRIGEAPVMIADEFPDMGYSSPESIGGTPVSIHVLVGDVDGTFFKAIKLGAKEVMPVTDQFDGERRATLIDPYGHRWLLASRVEDISFAEMSERFRKMISSD